MKTIWTTQANLNTWNSEMGSMMNSANAVKFIAAEIRQWEESWRLYYELVPEFLEEMDPDAIFALVEW